MDKVEAYEACIEKCRYIVVSNQRIPSDSDVVEKTRRDSVHTDECIGDENRKVVLYNIRYDKRGTLRSDIDVLNEYNQVAGYEASLVEYMGLLRKELDALNSPSTFERVGRTITSWMWSDVPRKERVVRRKQIRSKLKEIDAVLEEVRVQLPLYKSVATVTTTAEIRVKTSKLKGKYAKKLKKGKKTAHHG